MISGMPVCEALAHVEQHRSVFDVVQIKYNDEVWPLDIHSFIHSLIDNEF